MPSLGYLIDHPKAIASQQSKTHYPMALLLRGLPVGVPPARYLCPEATPYAFDQNGLGACVAFAATTIWNAMEHKDWGRWLFGTGNYSPPTGSFLAYKWLKNGTPDGSWPGDGIDSEGSYPEAVWKMAVRYGLPDLSGKVHKATAYYASPLANADDLLLLQQILMTNGPVNIATMWPAAWFKPPVGPLYLASTNLGSSGSAHSYTIIGWETYNGVVYLTLQNSWGPEWPIGNDMGIFRVPASVFYAWPMGPQVIWKITDRLDAPVPPPPDPKPPVPLKGDAVRVYDRKPRLVTVAAGTQLYRPDSVTAFVKLSKRVVDAYSPFAVDAASYALPVVTGGASQLAVVRKNKCTNVHDYIGQPAAAEAEGEE